MKEYIVPALARNCDHGWNSFGPWPNLIWRDGFALPLVSTWSFEMCVAIVLIAALTSSDSYIPPVKEVNLGTYPFSIRKVPPKSPLGSGFFPNSQSNKDITSPQFLSLSPISEYHFCRTHRASIKAAHPSM